MQNFCNLKIRYHKINFQKIKFMCKKIIIPKIFKFEDKFLNYL